MDSKFMGVAIRQAKLAMAKGEVPVGCCIVRDGEVIARAYNTRETDKNALCHAEVKAIKKACKKLGGWRLTRCKMYVTLEPCPMCAGAIVNSRIETVYFGASDTKAGAFGGRFQMNDMDLNHKPEIVSGVMEKECSELLKDFFLHLRLEKKKMKEETGRKKSE